MSNQHKSGALALAGLSNEYILILEFEMKLGVKLIENILHFLRLRPVEVCHDIFIIHSHQNIRL